MLIEKLFDNLSLTVEPFATCRLAEHWRLRLPARDWVTIHYVLAGEGELHAGSNNLLELRSNSLAIIPPGLKHAIQSGQVIHETGIEDQVDPAAPIYDLVAGPMDDTVLAVACGRIQAHYADSMGLFDHLNEAIVLGFGDSARMRDIFEALLEEYRHSDVASIAMMAVLMNQCLIQVFRRLSEKGKGELPWLEALDDPRMANVIKAMLEHPEEQHTLEQLADIAHMSRSTFLRHFDRSFGRTPMDYLRDVRLRRGAKLLQTCGMTVDGIAAKVGFASRSHFSRAFQQKFGCSPKEFRGQH